VHLAIGGSGNTTYASLTYNDQTYLTKNTTYIPLTLSKREVYLGNSDDVSESGFTGHIREFVLANMYVQPERVINVRN